MNLFKKLMPRDSFYLILFVCVSVLGASAVWVSKEKANISENLEAREEIIEEEISLDLSEKDPKRKPAKVKKQEEIVKVEKTPVEEKRPEPQVEKPVEPKVQVKEEAKSQAEVEAVASSQVEVKKVKLKKPVEGRIYKDFAHDKLVYSKTLDEWSTHIGIDIGASAGTEVVASLDGIVKIVENDQKLGTKIVIDHGNGLETVYKNILAPAVKVGEDIKTGQKIAKVSKGVGFEQLDEPHIHFEVLQAGRNIDPKSLF